MIRLGNGIGISFRTSDPTYQAVYSERFSRPSVAWETPPCGPGIDMRALIRELAEVEGHR